MTTTKTPFDHLPPTATSHFRLSLYAACYRVVLHLQHLASNTGHEPREALDEHPFLGRYLEEMLAYLPDDVSWEEGANWWATTVERWEAGATEHLPLRELTSAGILGPRERDGLMVVGLTEEDSRFGTMFARLQAPMAHRRPSVELIDQICRDAPSDSESTSRALLDSGLVEAVDSEAPRSEWQLRVPTVLWESLRAGRAQTPTWLQVHDSTDAEPIAALILDEGFRASVDRLPEVLGSGTAGAVVMRGMHGSRRLECLGSIASAMGRGLAVVDLSDPRAAEQVHWGVLGAYCTLTRRMPVVVYDLGPGEFAEPSMLRGYTGPICVALGLEGGLRGPVADRAVTLTVPFPGRPQRREHWQRALLGHEVQDLDGITDRFQIPEGHIETAGRLAVAHAQIAQRTAIRPADVAAARRHLNRQHLDTLAARVDSSGTWGDVVLDVRTMTQLRSLEQRCRERERVLGHLGRGFDASSGRGVRALFSGASGTGKTLAARVLASELGMDLYRVDLGAVVNKYVGETEKNFHRILSWAEELDVLLLLDEGDSVLSKRTDVKSANDRYANLETNYLLQRLETYQGILFITTNSAQYIDGAFQRRMDMVVNFVPPEAEERVEVWRLHLASSAAIDEEYLVQLARHYVMTGGQIRNVALHATTMAVAEDGGIVRPRHLELAIGAEYRKSGALGPIGESANDTSHGSAMDAMVQVLQ